MAGRKRSENDHHPADGQTKRSQRIENSEPSHAHDKPTGDKHHPPHSELDDVSAATSLGISESAARDRGESHPVTPYSRGQG